MDLLTRLNDLSASLAPAVVAMQEMQLKLADAQVEAEALAQAKYQEGYEAGLAAAPAAPAPVEGGEVAPAPVEGEKLFTQAEVDLEIEKAVQPLNADIAALNQKLVDVEAGIEAKVAEGLVQAVAAYKADLLAKFEAQQAQESQGEMDFKALLG